MENTPAVRRVGQARLEKVKDGAYDLRLGVNPTGAAVSRERLVRAVLLFGAETRVLLADLYEPGEGSVEGALTAMSEQTEVGQKAREAVGMDRRGAERVARVLGELGKEGDLRVGGRLRAMDTPELESLALDVLALMVVTRIELEETVRLEHWHERPTIV